MDKNKTGKWSFNNMKRGMGIAAAVLAIGASTTVVAAQNTDYFKMFFDGNVMNSAAAIDQVTIEQGIKMKVEESIIGGKSAIIIASFERENGAVFPEEAVIDTLELDLKNVRDGSS